MGNKIGGVRWDALKLLSDSHTTLAQNDWRSIRASYQNLLPLLHQQDAGYQNPDWRPKLCDGGKESGNPRIDQTAEPQVDCGSVRKYDDGTNNGHPPSPFGQRLGSKRSILSLWMLSI